MPNQKLIVTLAGLTAVLPTMALSEGPMPISECQFMQSYGPDVYYEDHTDIGAGFILYAERSEYGVAVTVADCFSGLTLVIRSGEGDQSTFKAFQKSTEGIVLDAAKSPERVTLSMIEDQFSSRGIWTNLARQDPEHCACAAFYPEAKGKKADWQNRYGHP